LEFERRIFGRGLQCSLLLFFAISRGWRGVWWKNWRFSGFFEERSSDDAARVGLVVRSDHLNLLPRLGGCGRGTGGMGGSPGGCWFEYGSGVSVWVGLGLWI
jgi:hypothetical protein